MPQTSTQTTQSQTVECPECANKITVAANVLVGEILDCSDCSAELEVRATNPVRVEMAPEVEEDWGE
jgi:alpha-aminoadipate/glutamate carrier protein LysW